MPLLSRMIRLTRYGCLSLAFLAAFCLALKTMATDRLVDKFVPLFNGESLEGWKNVNCAPSTWTVRDGMIHCSGKPTGELRTDRMYQNFILEAEWRHLQPKGNAGIFVWADALTAPGQPYQRGVEVQVLDGKEASWYTSHGDIFPIHGATWKPENGREEDKLRAYPTEMRCKPSPEWNHYRIECVDGAISLAVNGKVVTRGSQCNLRKGYICLESEGSPTDFRNLRIQELPSSPLEPAQVAQADEGFVSLYTGVDFSGWQVPQGPTKSRETSGWKVNDWQLQSDGTTTGDDNSLDDSLGDSLDKDLWSEDSYQNFELIVDWRWNEEAKKDEAGDTQAGIADAGIAAAGIADAGIILRGDPKYQINISQAASGSGGITGKLPADDAATPTSKADKPVGQWNRFHATVVDETVTVVLNGKTVTDKFRLAPLSSEARVSPRGKIALRSGGRSMDFANLFIKPLPCNLRSRPTKGSALSNEAPTAPSAF